MPERRRFLPVLIAVVAVAVVLVTARPVGDAEPAPSEPTPPPMAAVPGWEAPRIDSGGVGRDGVGRESINSPNVEAAGVDSVDSADGGPHGDAAERAVRTAERFARAWSTPRDDWWEQVSAHATANLAEALVHARPVSPPPQVAGTGEIYLGTPMWVRVRVPSDRGDLLLDLVADGDRWWVTAVDWRPRPVR
jgi:hypothetical protein